MSINHLSWGHFLGAAAALTLPLSLYGSKGLAPLFIILAVTAVGAKLFDDRMKTVPMPGRGPLTIVLTIPLLGAVSALWSLSPMSSLKTALIVGAINLIGLLMIKLSFSLEKRQRSFVEYSIIIGGLLGYSLLAIEQASNAGLSRFLQEIFGHHIMVRLDYTYFFNPGMSIATLYLWPFSVCLFRKWPLHTALPILALCAGSIFFSQADAPIFALVAGFIAFLTTRAMPSAAPKALAMVIVIGILFAPAITQLLPDPRTGDSSLTKYTDSTLHRLIIWHVAEGHILENPFLGGGLNSTRFLYSKKDRVKYELNNSETGRSWGVFSEPIPLHPHNAILQIWMELGALGAIALATLLVAILYWLRALPPWHAAAGFGFFTSALFIESISYGAWQSWWISGLWVCSILLVSILRTGQESTR